MHFDKLYRLHALLKGRRQPLPKQAILADLECSLATFKRLKDELIDRYGAPLEYDRQRNGYWYVQRQDDAPFELPGLWFSRAELFALLTIERQLQTFERGLVADVLKPLRLRVQHLLRDAVREGTDEWGRMRIVPLGERMVDTDVFGRVAEGLLARRRLQVVHRGRHSQSGSTRFLSPQRLVYYRDNWYVDAWCHWRDDLRTFALDTLRDVSVLDEVALDVNDSTMDAELATSYGIFAGPPVAIAHLRFSAHITPWIRGMRWHPDQVLRELADGGCEIELPYSNPTELVQDILRYGADAEVVGPDALRAQVRHRLADALAHYG